MEKILWPKNNFFYFLFYDPTGNIFNFKILELKIVTVWNFPICEVSRFKKKSRCYKTEKLSNWNNEFSYYIFIQDLSWLLLGHTFNLNDYELKY